MAKKRDEIRMTEAEARAFIETQRTVQVATIGPDGHPHVVPMWFAMEPDGSIILETFTKSQKVKNLERDPRITLLFEAGEAYPELRGVSIRAEAEVIQDDDQVHALHTKVLVRNQPEVPEHVLDDLSKAMAPKKTAVRVKPTRVMSWDHRKLAEGVY